MYRLEMLGGALHQVVQGAETLRHLPGRSGHHPFLDLLHCLLLSDVPVEYLLVGDEETGAAIAGDIFYLLSSEHEVEGHGNASHLGHRTGKHGHVHAVGGADDHPVPFLDSQPGQGMGHVRG
jgi:hypothetical protein